MKLLFHKEIDALIAEGMFTLKRKSSYETWIRNSQKARNDSSLDPLLNQYDKAEELLTWYTFASLIRMNTDERKITINEILGPIVGPSAIKSKIDFSFEKALLPSAEYLESITSSHPVRYVRKEIERHHNMSTPLEGSTYIDFYIQSREFLIPIEAKFTSDISAGVTYSAVRNQIARTIDVTLEAAKQRTTGTKVIFLLCVPEMLHNEGRFFYYKMRDYVDPEKIKKDLPHQSRAIDEILDSVNVVYWKEIASTIIGNAKKWGLLSVEEMELLTSFFEERLVQLSF